MDLLVLGTSLKILFSGNLFSYSTEWPSFKKNPLFLFWLGYIYSMVALQKHFFFKDFLSFSSCLLYLHLYISLLILSLVIYFVALLFFLKGLPLNRNVSDVKKFSSSFKISFFSYFRNFNFIFLFY